MLKVLGVYFGRHRPLYKIIEPLGHQAKERNDDFIQSYSQMINKFTKEFSDTFCMANGSIDWDKLVRFNSAITTQKK